MRDGRVLEGKIRSQTSKALIIRTARGTRRVWKRDVDEIIYRPFNEFSRKASRRPVGTKKPKLPVPGKPGRGPENRPGNDAPPSKKTPVRTAANDGPPEVPRLYAIVARAALLPGWGHDFDGRTKKAYQVGGVFAAGSGLALLLYGYAGERRRVFEDAGREALLVATLPANEFLGAGVDLRRAAGIVLLDRWNKKGGQSSLAAARAGVGFSLLLAYYFAQMLHAAWPELMVRWGTRPSSGGRSGETSVMAHSITRPGSFERGVVFTWRFNLQ